MRRVYLDHHATTPLDPRVLEAMMPYLTTKFGNAASRSHSFGWEAEKAVEEARKKVAALIGADPREIVFTSGATESDNLAIKGTAEAYAGRGDHIITAVTEHKAVLDTCRALEKRGLQVTYLPVQRDGLIELDALAEAITPRTILVSVMHANNEIGTIQPVAEIGRLCAEHGIPFHTDAAQRPGQASEGIALMSLSAHKMYGPKGVGALYVRRKPRVELAAQMDGGGHERGLRSGTLNVPAIVGFGEACAIAAREMAAESARMAALRDRLQVRLLAIPGAVVNGSCVHRLPNNLNVSFPGVDSESLLMALPDVAISSGSACSSATLAPSHVLRAIGLPEDATHAAVRFGLGRFTTEDEVDYAAERVTQAVTRLRELSPLQGRVAASRPTAT